MSEKKTVLVGCKVPNGLRLHVMKPRDRPIAALADAGMPGLATYEDKGFIDLVGPRTGRPAAPGASRRTEAFTAVDKELFDIWLEANRDNGLVTGGTVFLREEPKEEPQPEPKEELAAATEQHEHHEEKFDE